MGEATAKFGCDECGKSYRWKEPLAGKKVKCKCGHVMRVPESVEAEEEDEGMFELADESGPAKPPPPPPKPAAPPPLPDSGESGEVAVPPSMPTVDAVPAIDSPPDVESKLGEGASATLDPSSSSVDEFSLSGDSEVGMQPPEASGDPCPECGSGLAAGAVLCVNCGFNIATGQKLGGPSVASGLSDPADKPDTGKLGGMLSKMKGGTPGEKAISMGDAADDKLWKAKQVLIPAILVVVGLFLRMLLLQLHDGASLDPNGAVFNLIATLVGAAIGTALLVGAAFVTAMIMDMTFGSLPTAILKFAAAIIAPSGIAWIIAHFLGDWGIFFGFPAEIIMYFGLIYWFFDLDLIEIFVLAIINWVIQNFIAALILGLLMTAFM